MKKQILATVLSAVVAHDARATVCFITEMAEPPSACVSATQIVCPNATYTNCTACRSGSIEPTMQTVTISATESYTYGICLTRPGGGATCPDECPDSTWEDVSGQNYQVRCGGSILLPSCEYQCKAGYYGTGTTCTACPSPGTSAVGATAITECYIPSGTSFSDGTGSGTYKSDCYYK